MLGEDSFKQDIPASLSIAFDHVEQKVDLADRVASTTCRLIVARYEKPTETMVADRLFATTDVLRFAVCALHDLSNDRALPAAVCPPDVDYHVLEALLVTYF